MPFKPCIGITMGDPAGIGPEIIAKALAGRRVRALCRPFVIGSGVVMEGAARALQLPLIFEQVASVGHLPRGRRVGLLETGLPRAPRPGRPTAGGGRAALAAIEESVLLALEHRIDAIVTAPISKEAIRLAGSPYRGHTEMLASLTDTKRFAMMLVGGPLRVSLATIHIPLRDVPGSLTARGIEQVIGLTWEALHGFGLEGGRIAVCGLNPHAGEGGLMGDEDRRIIAPAVRTAARRGIPASGPWPADTIFYRSARGEFSAVVAMYHDQGLVPIKTLAFDRGVNITLGLPIIRTSVDHGTAYDIAGQGLASCASLVSAVELAARMAITRLGKS